MPIRGAFIGIDKHIDPAARDLFGAKRDATALWALFSDALPNMKSRLLVDAEATFTAIKSTIEETLSAAMPEDTVIFTFAGHGTNDHRLVAHDTTMEKLSATTLSMLELATAFRRTRARAVLCILDCCFSGGAPARVFEDTPRSRDPRNPLQELAGTGRILLAASNLDEFAYEHPHSRHGLLTNAFIEALLVAKGSISIGTAIDIVFDRVRADAGSMGVTQTPVLLGSVEGGLLLPAFHRGHVFNRMFPDAPGSKVGRDIRELSIFGIPQAVLEEWATTFKDGLNDIQLEAINKFRILDGNSLSVFAPTSSGKTFVGELAAARTVADGRKAVFLLPYRALVNEKFDQFMGLYGKKLGMRVVRCSGDFLDQTSEFIRGKYELGLLTYEMFLNLAVSSPHILQSIGLVVLDEAQFITDPGRGINVELLLTYLLASRDKGVAPQLITLSAAIGNVNDFDSWLNCKSLVTSKRPVPLVEGVLDRQGKFQFLDAGGQIQIKQLIASHEIIQRKKDSGAQDILVPLVRKLLQEREQVIIFRNMKGKTQGSAAYLAADLQLPPADSILNDLPAYDPSSSSSALRECLKGGTAFHNTNLAREERVIVERAFRDPKGMVRVLVATTTVAAGINTPASTVILAENQFIGEDGRPFTVAEYKNMAGRAGRKGFSEQGKAIILAENEIERSRLFQLYVMGRPEALRSSFDRENLDTWIVRLLAQVSRVPRKEVVHLLTRSYGGYLANRNDPGWKIDMQRALQELVARMLELELLEQEGDFIQLTLLGRACGQSSLSFQSAMRLVELLRHADNMTAEGLMAIIQALDESDGGYTPMVKKGRKEAVWPGKAAAQYGAGTVRILQRYARDDFDYLARCKRASILWDWIAGISVETLEDRYSLMPNAGRVGPGDVRKFADATRFHLRSAHQILTVMYIGEGPSEEHIEKLSKRLEVGLSEACIDLLELSLPLSRGEYLALSRAGVTNPDQFWALPKETLEGFFGEGRALQLQALRRV